MVLSVVILADWRRCKQWQKVLGVFFLLLGLGFLAADQFAAPDEDQPGIWQVVIRFNDAGRKKVALLSAEKAEGLPKEAYPKHYLAFLVDGDLTFGEPVWGPNTEGVYYLANVGLSKEGATRIAKGIAGP